MPSRFIRFTCIGWQSV